MKEIFYNKNLTLREVFKAYCKNNGFSILQVAKTLCIPKSTLSAWVRGERGLRAKSAQKIRAFLEGDYVIDAEVIASWIEHSKQLT